MDIDLTTGWKRTPGLSVGILRMNSVENSAASAALDASCRELEAELRTQYAGFDRSKLRQLPRLKAYHTYYKRFRKSYHVQLQLESIALKGRTILSPSPLVQAMFMAELKNHLLTSGHDLDIVRPPLAIAVADGSENYQRLNYQNQDLKSGDLYIRDGEEILSSIIYGPDFRTRIQPHTIRVLYTVYGVPGIDPGDVENHLEYLQDTVLGFTPSAEVEQLAVFQSGQELQKTSSGKG